MRVRLGEALLAVVITLCAACSLVANRTQCERDRDCADKGAKFAGTVCSDGLCVARGAADASVDASPGGGCASTEECVTRHGAHSVCLGGAARRCATVTSEDCSTVLGNDRSDDALIFGVLVDTSRPDADDLIAGVELARNDFQQALAGVPAGPGKPPRPLVIVVCAEQKNAVRAARHLVEDLDAPAIVGPTSSARLVDVATQVTVAASTLLLSPAASSHTISSLKDEGLVFRTAPSDALVGRVMALVTNRIALGEARVVVAQTEGDLGEGIRLGVESSLRLDGQTLAESKASGRYRVVSLARAPTDQALRQAASAISAATPAVVLLAGADEQASLPQAIELAWPSTLSARPTYLLASNVATPGFLRSIASASDTLLERVRVVYPANGRSLVFQTFRRLLASGVSGTPQVFEAAKAYDAAYVLALAAIPGGADAVSGRELADAIPAFLMRGDRVEVGAIGLTGVAARLSVQSIVDLEGASGPLEFDSRGDVETGVEIGCLRRDSRAQVLVQPSELYYRAATTAAVGSLQGTFGPCTTGP